MASGAMAAAIIIWMGQRGEVGKFRCWSMMRRRGDTGKDEEWNCSTFGMILG